MKPSSTVVKLNIGGYKYITTKQTLCKPHENTFFSALFSDNFPHQYVNDDWYFIDRDGKYFECILEFLRTGDIVIPENYHDSVLREAEFYGYKLPLSESSPYLMYVTDEWLTLKKNELHYNSLGTLPDEIIREVKLQFKNCALKNKKIESKFYFRDPTEVDNACVLELAKTAKRQHETQDIKAAFLSETQKSYDLENWHVDINQAYFACLNDEKNRDLVVQMCRSCGLSITVVPKFIQINWKGTLGGCPVGYQFVHTPD